MYVYGNVYLAMYRVCGIEYRGVVVPMFCPLWMVLTLRDMCTCGSFTCALQRALRGVRSGLIPTMCSTIRRKSDGEDKSVCKFMPVPVQAEACNFHKPWAEEGQLPEVTRPLRGAVKLSGKWRRGKAT